jgi:hypothetical protein
VSDRDAGDQRTLPAVDARGRGLRVTFFRCHDRLAHRIEFVDGGVAGPALVSVEGDARDPWPPSPPLQQLRCEEPAAGRRVLLLVGMAGRSHWSVSVEADPAGPSLVWDVACRLVSPPRWLGSTYRAEAAVGAETAQPLLGDASHAERAGYSKTLGPETAQRVGWGRGRWSGVVSAEDAGSQPALQVAADQLQIVADGGRWPATVRWKYRVSRRADNEPPG